MDASLQRLMIWNQVFDSADDDVSLNETDNVCHVLQVSQKLSRRQQKREKIHSMLKSYQDQSVFTNSQTLYNPRTRNVSVWHWCPCPVPSYYWYIELEKWGKYSAWFVIFSAKYLRILKLNTIQGLEMCQCDTDAPARCHLITDILNLKSGASIVHGLSYF